MAGLIGGGPTSQIAGAYQQREADRRTWEREKEMFRMEMAASNTAHQRQVRDMKLAGLNPILSANMSGASQPSGNVHESKPYWSPDKMDNFVSSAQQYDRLKQQEKTVNSNANLADESAKTQQTQQIKNAADTKLSMELAGKAKSERHLTDVNAAKSSEEVGKIQIEKSLQKMDEIERRMNWKSTENEATRRHMDTELKKNPTWWGIEQLKNLINPLQMYKAMPKRN